MGKSLSCWVSSCVTAYLVLSPRCPPFYATLKRTHVGRDMMLVLLSLERRALHPSLPGVAAAQLVWAAQGALLSSSPTEPAGYTHAGTNMHTGTRVGTCLPSVPRCCVCQGLCCAYRFSHIFRK